MYTSPLNQALAENLAYYMEQKGLKQMALAKKCGIGQTTISLYLTPERRKMGKDGKPGSAKLTEVEMLAAALELDPIDLLTPAVSVVSATIETTSALPASSDSIPKERASRRKSEKMAITE